MIKIYKGNPIFIKRIKGRTSFKAIITLYYRYGFFKVEKYQHTVTLNENSTLRDVWEATKEIIKQLDNTIKL